MSQRRNGGNKSQLTQESEEVVDPTEIVNSMVRYIINRAGTHSMITRSELVRNVTLKAKVKFDEIVQQVTNILNNVSVYYTNQQLAATGTFAGVWLQSNTL